MRRFVYALGTGLAWGLPILGLDLAFGDTLREALRDGSIALVAAGATAWSHWKWR